MFEFMMADKHLSLDENDFRRAAAVRLISQLFSEFAAAPLVHLELCCEGSWHPHTPDLRHISVSGSTVPLLEYEDGEDTEPLTLIFNIVDDPPVRAACLQTIFETIQLSHVKKLKFYAPDAYFLIDWSQVLSKLQDLRELIIGADLFGPLIEILGTAAAERSSGQAGSVERELYLPRLESLEIEQRRTDRDMFDLLGQALKNRRDWGSPLPSLCLFMHTWQLEADLEKALKESVGYLGIFTYVIAKGKKLEESSEESSEDGDDEHEGNEEDEDQSEDDMVGSQPDEDGGMDVDGGDEELGSRSDGQN
ncbi:hypothetical protein EWM64_g10230 [Hericium alpestre]|uniref:Uncharacterized protein n=1 Tax=Hericium alpestre TaxID=135208 RepID=A0A4Y9ZGQ2_9AGAM|nr:hypothetical protein EWM64_g10230 [Hericium alpestre]